MFTLSSIKKNLAPDDSTSSLLIGNVVSPMSSEDIRRLVPTARRWYYISNVMRTDFVAEFDTKIRARKAYEQIKGVLYLNHPLEVTFVHHKATSTDFFDSCTQSAPQLFFALPPADEFDQHLKEARKSISSLSPIPPSKQRWVDFTV
ncbi:unnamed protein product [Phytomonas sp. EM1]|nr:unnamed protein product [Phytomonas sp. EM1]|eukprot:CCW63712.1 unnamed protein product [Phytomonas sp. isolate EM1]